MKAAIILACLAGLMQASPIQDKRTSSPESHKPKGPFTFTSTYNVVARPGEVVDAQNNKTGGLEGASGQFNYGINSKENVICFNITIDGFRGEYQSPAKTATHIHQGDQGKAGPPRYVLSWSKWNRSNWLI